MNPVLRGLLGLYVAGHFALLLPYGRELFSSAGMLGAAADSPFAAFPNPLLWGFDSPGIVAALLGTAALAGLLLASGVADRRAAGVAWVILAWVFQRNPLIANPSIPFIGWLLLAHSAMPREAAAADRARLRGAAWIVMAVGYGWSGWTKLDSPSWLDGTAIAHVLANPLARPTALRELLLALPDELLVMATHGALALELAFPILAASRRLRPWAWGMTVGMHLSLIVLIDFAELSLGMLLVHAFTFDASWHQRRAPAKRQGHRP